MPVVNINSVKTGGGKYKGNGVKNTEEYITDEEKTKKKETIDDEKAKIAELMADGSEKAMNSVIHYMENETKTLSTDSKRYVSGVNCSYNTAMLEFAIARDNYYQYKGEENIKKGATANKAFHIIQSFKETDIPDEEVHQMGLEFAHKICGDEFQCIVASHVNSPDGVHGLHKHNHILVNAYSCDLEHPHKYRDNKKNLAFLRQISDEIAAEHGYHVILNQDPDKSHSYCEYMHIQDETSWKEQLRIDIENTMKVANSWKEYKSLLESAGYEIQENARSNTYKMPGSNLQVRDSKLGRDYKKSALELYWKNKELEKETTPEKEETKKREVKEVSLHVRRYTSSGRRRSDLEMLFLLVVQILKYVKQKFEMAANNEVYAENPVYKEYKWKVARMLESVKVAKEMGITSEQQLQDTILDTIKDLNHMRKINNENKIILESMDEIITILNTIDEDRNFFNSLGLTEKDLNLTKYSESEIRQNLAAQNPMSKNQSSKLKQILDEVPSYKLAYRFNEITGKQAAAVIEYLNNIKAGKIIEKPDCLLTLKEYEIRRLEARYKEKRQTRNENLENKFKEDATKDQISKIKTLMDKDENIKNKLSHLDLNEISKYEAIKILNYYTSIDPLKNYKKPVDFEPITDALKKGLKELLILNPEYMPSYDIEQIDNTTAQKLYNYLMDYNIEPDFFTPEEPETDLYDLLGKYPMETQTFIINYMTKLDQLNKLGLTSTDLCDEYKSKYEILELMHEKNVEKQTELTVDFKTLKELEYNINLAGNPKFAVGPEYKGNVKKEVCENGDIVIIEVIDPIEATIEEDKELEAEADKIEKDGRKGFITKDKFFMSKNLENEL